MPSFPLSDIPPRPFSFRRRLFMHGGGAQQHCTSRFPAKRAGKTDSFEQANEQCGQPRASLKGTHVAYASFVTPARRALI